MTSLVAFTSTKQGKIVLTVSVEVKDFSTWKKGFDAGAAIREKAGIKVISIGTALDNKNQVMLLEEAENVDVANKFINMLKSKEKDGDMSKLEVKLFDKVE